jgi:hypothetical protein
MNPSLPNIACICKTCGKKFSLTRLQAMKLHPLAKKYCWPCFLEHVIRDIGPTDK